MQKQKTNLMCIFFACLGSIITIIFKKVTQFTILTEINFIDAISIMITVILALYLSFIVEKNNNIERTKKDTIITFFTEFDDLIKATIEKTLAANSNKSFNVVSDFKIIRIRLNELEKIVNSNNMLTNTNVLQDLKVSINELWSTCTGDEQTTKNSTQEEIKLLGMNIDVLIYKIKLGINNNK